MTADLARVPSLSVQELKTRLDTSPPLLIDVREDWELATCRIGAPLHIPLGQLQGRLSEIPKDRPLVAYCHHGGRSARATALLLANGFEALNLTGGIHAWATMIDQSVATY